MPISFTYLKTNIHCNNLQLGMYGDMVVIFQTLINNIANLIQITNFNLETVFRNTLQIIRRQED